MELNEGQKRLIEIGRLAVNLDIAEDNYWSEVELYRDLQKDSQLCGSQKPSKLRLKQTELNFKALNDKLNLKIKEFRAIKQEKNLASEDEADDWEILVF